MPRIGQVIAVHARWHCNHCVGPHVKSLALRALRMPGMSALSRYNDASNNQKSLLLLHGARHVTKVG